ncbi:hypothetical protein GQ53DRAFT_307973 [Thozetella sp. PMI_491]|nr:hypothetical protein GQ53DRAFT_307973 [Thozetella sp. PMI_491]
MCLPCASFPCRSICLGATTLGQAGLRPLGPPKSLPRKRVKPNLALFYWRCLAGKLLKETGCAIICSLDPSPMAGLKEARASAGHQQTCICAMFRCIAS